MSLLLLWRPQGAMTGLYMAWQHYTKLRYEISSNLLFKTMHENVQLFWKLEFLHARHALKDELVQKNFVYIMPAYSQIGKLESFKGNTNHLKLQKNPQLWSKIYLPFNINFDFLLFRSVIKQFRNPLRQNDTELIGDSFYPSKISVYRFNGILLFKSDSQKDYSFIFTLCKQDTSVPVSEKMVRFSTVSYTHLTLPTNREV